MGQLKNEIWNLFNFNSFKISKGLCPENSIISYLYRDLWITQSKAFITYGALAAVKKLKFHQMK